MAENHPGPAMAIRPAVSPTDNHRTVTAGEGTVTASPVVAVRENGTTAMIRRPRVMVDIRATNGRTPFTRTIPLGTDGIGYRMSRLIPITANLCQSIGATLMIPLI